MALIGTGGFDLRMLAYGYIPRGYDQIHSARSVALRDACLARAHQLGLGIAAMKVVYDARQIDALAVAAIRHALADDRVDLLVIGMRLPAEIDANVGTLTGVRPRPSRRFPRPSLLQ